MGSAVDLSRLVNKGRDVQLDWLPGDADINTIAEAMIALANSAGGTLILGIVGDNIQGVDDSEDVVDRVIQAALSTDPPLIIPLPQRTIIDNRPVVSAQIPSGMPHVYATNGRYLRRTETENIPLSPRDLRRLMLDRGEISFETDIVSGTGLSDIDWDKVKFYAQMVGNNQNPEHLLLRRGCLVRFGDELRPTTAGLLLFGRENRQFIRGAEIIAVRFAGETMSDTFSREDITGTLPEQIQRAETFLIDHLRKDVSLQARMARQESYEYPMEAARELVVNAVAHRDYSIMGNSIHLFIFSNRMEVHSPGGLPGPMTLSNLRDERFSRNPAIVQVLADMGFIERLGYGVDRVIELMQEKQLRSPEFLEGGGTFRVTLFNTPGDASDDNKFTTEYVSEANDGHNISEEYRGLSLNPRQEAALQYLQRSQANRITNSDLKGMFPDVHPETIRRDLVDLVNKGILNKMGQKRGSYYVLKSSEETEKTS